MQLFRKVINNGTHWFNGPMTATGQEQSIGEQRATNIWRTFNPCDQRLRLIALLGRVGYFTLLQLAVEHEKTDPPPNRRGP